MAFKYHGFAWSRGFDIFDGRGHMSQRYDNKWNSKYNDDDWDESGWRHRGKGHGMTYEMSDEDLALTSDEYAKSVAEKMYGTDVVVEPLEISEEGVVAYQVLEEGKLIQVLIIDLEEETTSLMFR